MRIGILALQGAFAEHRSMLEGLGADCVEIRQRADLMGGSGCSCSSRRGEYGHEETAHRT